jgi:lathosterol oxidase
MGKVNFISILGEFISHSAVINTSAHHFVHHVYFNYNYGQYFTFWDRLGMSHRQPTDEQYVKAKRDDQKVMARQAYDAEEIEAETLGVKPKHQ